MASIITFTWYSREKEYKESGSNLNLLGTEQKQKILDKMREISIKSSAATTSIKSECLKCLICGIITLTLF